MIGANDPKFPKRLRVIEHDGSDEHRPKGYDKSPDYGGVPIGKASVIVIISVIMLLITSAWLGN